METTTENREEVLRIAIRKRVRQVFLTLAFQGAILFLAAGRLDWWPAWGYMGLYGALILVNGFLLRNNPETVAERGEGGENWKTWDKVVGAVFGVFYFIGILLVAGLDQRFGWTGPLPAWVHPAGGALFLAGGGLFSWAMVTNAYFSTVVRIQADRGHAVCREGPYRFVRHPGYVGAMIQSIGGPLFFGSWWALIPGVLAAVALAVRTALEDRTLKAELAGYSDYAATVPWRLVPGIW